MTAEELLRRYAAGERDFTGVDLSEARFEYGIKSAIALQSKTKSASNRVSNKDACRKLLLLHNKKPSNLLYQKLVEDRGT